MPVGVDCVSPAKHSVFSNPVELLEFIAKMHASCPVANRPA